MGPLFYTMVVEVEQAVEIGVIDVIIAAPPGQTVVIESVKAALNVTYDPAFLELPFMSNEERIQSLRLHDRLDPTDPDFDAWAAHVELHSLNSDVIQLDSTDIERRLSQSVAFGGLAKFVVLQIAVSVGTPIIKSVQLLPPPKVDAYCSASTGFAVCFCPPGQYGTGVGPSGCSKTAWTLVVPVSLDWANASDVEHNFEYAEGWVADEIRLWQVMLGLDTSDSTGSEVPHYWMSSTTVSVLEDKPGHYVATLFPLFRDSATAEEARARLLAHLSANDDAIMSGTALLHAIHVRRWDADVERGCSSADPDACEEHSLCLDASGDFGCECAAGLPVEVQCFPVQDCATSHENCHINERCVVTCDLDECAEDVHECGANAVCVNTVGSYDCTCSGGFSGNGMNCTEVDECLGSTHDCHHTAICENLKPSPENPKGFDCICGAGFDPINNLHSNQLQCEQRNECEVVHNCHHEANCTDTYGSFDCSCNAGYVSTGAYMGVHCEDVDECEGAHSCSTQADCNNTVGGYECSCQAGWVGTGFECSDLNECDLEPYPCDAHASCTNLNGTFECQCHGGYRGNGSSCIDADECATHAHDCDVNAACNNNDGSFACVCNAGWAFADDLHDQAAAGVCDDVDECAGDSDNVLCDAQASCVNTNGSYACTCNDGFTGDGESCLDLDSCATLGCHEDADCRQDEVGTWQCQCLSPWYTGNGIWCQENECVTGNHNCDVNADCVDVDGAFTCSCRIGWEGDGVTCVDINECSNRSMCAYDSAAYCLNTNGSFACPCLLGYMEGATGECADVDECDELLDNCHDQAVCTNTHGSFTCTCSDGFIDDLGLGVECRNLDECKEGSGTASCGFDASCQDTFGSFMCACYPGFESDGTSCLDLDECESGASNTCHRHALCSNTQGSFACSCLRPGWEGDGLNCSDVDECATGEFQCAGGAVCSNTDGGYECVCVEGFWSDYANGVTACVDVDECDLEIDNCHIGAECTNSIGSFSCNCSLGWIGNGTDCVDVDECAEHDDELLCPGAASCLNTDGSFACACPRGLAQVGDLCLDVDECLVEAHDCHHLGGTCNNTDGSFECRCDLGWQGNGVDCEDLDECELPGPFDGNLHNCLDVPFGECTNTNGSFTCGCASGYSGENCQDLECPAGQVFVPNTKFCGVCTAGTFSQAGAAVCESCEAGTFSGEGAEVCLPCPAGKLSRAGSASCDLLAVNSSCSDCTFAAVESGGTRVLYRIGSCDSCLHLSITSQGVSFIDGAFDDMEQLQSLDLSFNEMRGLRRVWFKDLNKVTVMNLEGNRLRSLADESEASQDALAHLVSLKTVTIRSQKPRTAAAAASDTEETVWNWLANARARGSQALDASGVTTPRRARLKARTPVNSSLTSELRDVRKLSVSNNRIGVVSAKDLSLPRLQILSMTDSDIYSIEEGAFANTQLIHLDMRNNQFRKTLLQGTFSGADLLAVINLQDNRISGIEAGVFSNLTNLKELYLSGNLLCASRSGSSCLGAVELPADAFLGLEFLEILDLSNNYRLARLQSNLLSDLPKLQVLSVRQFWVGFGLRVIDAGAFDHFRLHSLDLSGNALESLPHNIFQDQTQLQWLDLGYNDLEWLNADLLSRLSMLETLRLAHNDLVRIDNGAFDALSSLRVLDLSYNHLMVARFSVTSFPSTAGPVLVDSTNFPTAPFSKLGELRVLDLSFNELTSARGDLFRGLLNLQNLSLAFNRIADIEAGCFENLTNLTVLDLQGNHYSPFYFEQHAPEHGDSARLPSSIGGLRVEYYHDLQSRYELYARRFTAHGRLPRYTIDWGSLVISNDLFSSLSSLKMLHLSHNGLRAIPPGTFASLTTLTTLSIEWNFVPSFHDYDFAPLVALEELRFQQRGPSCSGDECWNPLICVPGQTLATGIITDLNDELAGWLPNCTTSTVALFACEGCDFTLSNGTTLTSSGDCSFCSRIDLSRKNIMVMQKDTFSEANRARHLDLQGNMLTQIDSGSLSGLTSLQTLNIKDNQLTRIRRESFRGLSQLRLLDVSDNRIAAIEAGAFSFLDDLEWLLLGGHRLQQIDIAAMGVPVTLRHLDISRYEFYRAWDDLLSLPKSLDRSKTMHLQPAGTEVIWSKKLDFNNLEVLNMEGLGLSVLTSFEGLQSLRELLLGGNQLESLSADGALSNLQGLQVLRLNNNQLTSISPSAFQGLASVAVLDLSSNKLEQLGEGAFTGLDNLVDLVLSRNRTVQCLTAAPAQTQKLETSYSTPAGYFSDPISLEDDAIRLPLCGFHTMESCSGCSFWKGSAGQLFREGNCDFQCRGFDLSQQGITSTDLAVFHEMEYMRMLVLSDNRLTTIHNATFQSCLSLQFLDLSRNSIVKIEPGAFSTLKVLRHLSLGQNALENFSVEILRGLDALAFLDLQHNRISTIAAGAFDLPLLQVVKLSNNRIRMDEGTEPLLPESSLIEELQLDFNYIDVLPRNAFNQAKRLRFLMLSANQITRILPHAFDGLSSLIELHLDGNSLGSLPDDAFNGLSALQVLEMRHSGVESVNSGTFRGLGSLRVLNLQHNQLQQLMKGVFAPFENSLLQVDLSKNRIWKVEAQIFDPSQKVRYLNLTNNDLQSLEPGAMPNVDMVDVFKRNPLSCIPVFDPETVLIDFEYSRLPSWAVMCLPSQCAGPLSSRLARRPEAPWTVEERSVVKAIELVTSAVRRDVGSLFDELHLAQGMYVDQGHGLRTWCTPVHAAFQPALAPCSTPGFYGNPCRPCPANFFCPGSNQSLPCPQDLVSLEGSDGIDDCWLCRPGQYSLQDTRICKTCEEGFFCTEAQRFFCPEYASCPPGSDLPTCYAGFYFDSETKTCLSLSGTKCVALSTARTCAPGQRNCTCSEDHLQQCHMLAYCTAGDGDSATAECSCPTAMLGDGYGANGCDSRGFTVRIVYRETACLSEKDADILLALMGDIECTPGSTTGCDHIHYTFHKYGLGVNVLFPHTSAGQAAAEAAADAFNSFAPELRRDGLIYPSAVEPSLGARVYAWNGGSTSAPVPVLPAGMQVQQVYFEPACEVNGCWVLKAAFTSGSSEAQLETFNTFYLPYAVGSDTLSYDYGYADNGILATLEPANFPCRVHDYVAANGDVTSLPVSATGCCFGTAFDAAITNLGGDGGGRGLLGKYRVSSAFAAYAAAVYPELCPGGFDDPSIDDNSGSATTPKPEDRFPDSVRAGAHHAASFIAAGQGFVGLDTSPGIVSVTTIDGFLGMYSATIKIDEQELRTRAGLLTGSVGVEHAVDFFLGYATFKPATSSWVLDSMATQTAIHVEKTSFFTASTHGVNDYSFLEYVNLRLVAVYQDGDVESTGDNSTLRMARTNQTRAAHYVQVTFTLGSKYDVSSSSGLIPLDSVRAGKGAFFAETESAGNMHHKCLEFTSSPGNEFPSSAEIEHFNRTLQQSCAPGAVMCANPVSIPDGFVSFNIPLGIDFLDAGPNSIESVFVDTVISAVDTEARSAQTNPGIGEAPWQMKTTLSGAIPIVTGGINIFCDTVVAKTDLKNVADIDIIVGTAADVAELSRLKIVEDAANTELDTQGLVDVDSDSIEAGLLTLVIKGNPSYFESGSVNTRSVSLELEDVITLHFMEGDGVASDGAGSQGKQQIVKNLLAEAPNDDGTGLGVDEYSLNGAFYFKLDRTAQRAHLEVSARLLEQCPLNPAGPTASAVMETCVTRRDVRFRDFPWRQGAVSTAMEVSHTAGEAPLTSASLEASFFTTVLGSSDYARQLAVGFAGALDAKYELNGRYRRAFWVNPGYEWAPTQTGGASRFQVSQKLFLFALVTLDERLASSAGNSIFDSPRFAGAPQDVNSDGASETTPNLPNVPAARRRVLLTVDPSSGESATLSAAELAFPVTRRSVTASAFGVPVSLVATFAVQLQLSDSVASLSSPAQVQVELQAILLSYVTQTASPIESVQVVSLTRHSHRRSIAEAAVEMLVVFAQDSSPTFDLGRFAALPQVQSVTPLQVGSDIVLAGKEKPPNCWGTDEVDMRAPSTGIGSATIAGICAGAASLLLAAACGVWRLRTRKHTHRPMPAQITDTAELAFGSCDVPHSATSRAALLSEMELSTSPISMLEKGDCPPLSRVRLDSRSSTTPDAVL